MERTIEKRLARLEGDHAGDDGLADLSDDELTILIWEVLRALAAHPDTAEVERTGYRQQADKIEADLAAQPDIMQRRAALHARPEFQQLIGAAGGRGP